MKIYFAGSIRGGRGQINIYKEMIAYLKNFGEVLTEHVGDSSLSEKGEKGMADRDIYIRDMEWLSASDMVVAEVTSPSLGVGFEIAKAIALNKKVICFHKKSTGYRLSAMIAGCPDLKVEEYEDSEDFEQKIKSLLSK
jgi:nucleoside 2-deoxyribosyltransferase